VTSPTPILLLFLLTLYMGSSLSTLGMEMTVEEDWKDLWVLRVLTW
jgi:hypothetical protein